VSLAPLFLPYADLRSDLVRQSRACLSET
jgi:hypothetical protein